MKVLWYEITIPAGYLENNAPIAGWQDSLQAVVQNRDDMELYISFEGTKGMECKTVNGVTYLPLIPKASLIGRKFLRLYDANYVRKQILPLLIRTIEELKPDVIHIFGTEWGIGEIAKYCNIPVVVHMMGCVAPYVNASYPPNYSFSNSVLKCKWDVLQIYRLFRSNHYNKTWINAEHDNFQAVHNYMGRTSWDYAMCNLFHPHCKYFYCSEALRPSFLNSNRLWEQTTKNQLKLISVGCTTHWKGMDTVLKTADVLKQKGVAYEWDLAGKMPSSLRKEIEKTERLKFKDCNINILGFVNSEELIEHLLAADIYVHTAYIDNSPNTVCEAQYLGLPIIATNVGGIPSLIENGKEGLLIPANDPYRLAYEIIQLANDKNRQQEYSKASMKKARERHDPDVIYKDLMACYNTLISNRTD